MDVLRYSAFTDRPDGGNPAGIVLDAAGMTDARMQAVAADVGYSETAFVTARDDAGRVYRLRYFSPRTEVAFCGHATIATAVALAERVGPGPLAFDTPVGAIAVDTTADRGTVRATLTSVPTTSRPADDAAVDEALAALRWSRADLDPAFPPHVAFAGEHHLVLAAATRARLADLHYDVDGLTAVMTRHHWTTVHLFWQEHPGRFHVRQPFPVGGVVEDAATGAAAAAFGGYLLALGRVRQPTTLALRQGEDMGRPSDLTVTVDPASPRVRVSGQAVPLPAGSW